MVCLLPLIYGIERMNDQPMKEPSQISSRLLLMLPSAAALLLCSPLARAAASYPATVLADGPVAYYRLEETSGTTAADSTANHFDAIYAQDLDTNGVTLWPELGLPGINTNSILFRYYLDSLSAPHHGFVDIPYNPVLNPVAGDGQHGAPFSAECWVQPLTQPSDYSIPLSMFGKYEGSAPYLNASGWNFYQTPGPSSIWVLNVKNGPFISGSPAIQPLSWYHLAVTFDGSTFVFYVNGTATATSGGWTTYLANHGFDGQIGAGDNSGFLPFNGSVDEVAFYTNALTAAQITNHYAAGLTNFSNRAFPPLVIQDPGSISVSAGSAANFTVIADGATPLSYQWLRGGAPIGGAASNPYSFVTAYPADDGAQISVRLSNVFGVVTSAVATLTVNPTLDIDHNPFSITRVEGSNSMAAFRVAASGAVPISYQWFKVSGGTTSVVAGATSDTLWLSGLRLSDDGSSYFARVTNQFFVKNSDPATLSVVPRTNFVPITGYARVVVGDHPVAYWRLDEASGSTDAVDAVGSFDGAYGPQPAAAAPIISNQVPGAVLKDTNTAITISGGEIVSIPYALELNPVTGPWSFEAWIKPAATGDPNFPVPFSSMWNSDSGGHLFGWNMYQHPDGYWTFNAYNGSGGGSFTSEFNDHPLDTNKWYHMVITDDLINLRFYVNNVLGVIFSRDGFGFKPNGINGDPAVAGAATVLGQRSDFAFDPFNGSIDEVAVYNYALSAAQIRNHFLYTTVLNIAKSGNNVVLTWPAGTLQAAGAVTGTYTNVTGASSPYTNSISGSPKFYRVKLQ